MPGEATPAYAVERITLHKDSSFFTKKITVSAWLHNTGRVALRPTVKINGKVAKGLTVLRTKDVDQYVATLNVPIYGGPLSYNVDVQTLVQSWRHMLRIMCAPGQQLLRRIAIAKQLVAMAIARIRK